MPTKIDQYSLTTVPVEQYANDKLLGCATSFVWKHGERHFLITNWHIATGKNAQTEEQLTIIRPEYLRAHFNLRFDNFGKEQRDIKLYDNDGHQLWFAHPDFRTRRTDVVAIPLDIRSGDLDINLHPINLLRSEVDLAVSIGMDVFILGYPFGHKPPGFPVWKRGSIASEPDLTHSDLGYMLVDTASLPGMSGAPVIRRSWSAHSIEGGGTSTNGAPQSKFIGIYSGRRLTDDNKETQLGLVWTARDVKIVVEIAVLGTHRS